MVNYSELKCGERYRILDCSEIWTKRGKKDDSTKKLERGKAYERWFSNFIKVYKEPEPLVIDGSYVYTLNESIDFFGYEFEKWLDGKETLMVGCIEYVYGYDYEEYLSLLISIDFLEELLGEKND